MQPLRLRWQGLVVVTLVGATPVMSGPISSAIVVDACDAIEEWSAHPADGVSLEIALDQGVRDGAIRFDFDIPGGGYAVARRALDLPLPENYEFRFRLRGEALPNHLEFKLIDDTGENVWWSVRRDFDFPRSWQSLTVKRRHIQFAWGPKGGGEIRHVAALELAITAGSGGSGSVWIDQLELVPLPPTDAVPAAMVATASSARSGRLAPATVDDDRDTVWSPESDDRYPWLALDLGGPREYGGVELVWEQGRHTRDFLLESSDDGISWRTLRTVLDAHGPRTLVHLPEAESSLLRMRVLRSADPGPLELAEVDLKPVEWAPSKLEFLELMAREAPRGTHPRGMIGEQNYWTVVGVDADPREGLLGEDGAFEVGREGFSIEPFLYRDGQLITWSDAQIEQSLDGGHLPMPLVHWMLPDLRLEIAAFGTGEPGASAAIVRYAITNQSREPITTTLFLAVRPYQVNPPPQFLNQQSGIATIETIERSGREIHVDGETRVVTLDPPQDFGAATFDEGGVVAAHLRQGRVPPRERVHDSFGAASAAIAYHLELGPGEEESVSLWVPLHATAPLPPTVSGDAVDVWVQARRAESRGRWRQKLDRVTLELPAHAADVVQTLKSQVGYVLVNRAGPAIQPGARSYARSWIRDGALTSWALLRLGDVEPAASFLKWYAPHQYDNGKIPCVVDARGADPVPEHDSSGEFIFLVATLYRHTGDRELLHAMWPRVRAAATYLDALRSERRTSEYEAAGNARFYGILPPSISHEGYAAKPMHSYWDDFFALRGFKDAVFLAGELGETQNQAWLATVLEEFEHDLGASVRAALEHHGIDYVPGCADLGDFDATSTTVALSPAEALDILPAEAIERTFEKYYEFFVERRDGAPWEAFTPYEIRNVGAFVRLGWRERAGELLDFFLAQRQPASWRQWPEVVRSDRRQAGFLGDLPHTWVGSDYVRSVLDMLVYRRAQDDALVLGAGVQSKWLEPSPGVVVRDLPLPGGTLGFTMVRTNRAVEVEVSGQFEVPTGGIVVAPPLPDGVHSVTVDGRPVGGSLPEVRIDAIPAKVVFHL